MCQLCNNALVLIDTGLLLEVLRCSVAFVNCVIFN